MVLEEDKIVIQNDAGVSQEFYKLVEFIDTKTGRNFIIYTDNKRDKNNKLNIYSNVVEKNGDNIKFIPITDDGDKEIVKKALIQVKMNLQ